MLCELIRWAVALLFIGSDPPNKRSKGIIGEEERVMRVMPYIKMKSEFIVLIHTCGGVSRYTYLRN